MALLDYTASARVIGRRSVLQFASALGLPAFVLGCGGDSTGPDAPNVAGRYLRTDAFDATTCTPQRPPPGGTVILDAFSLSVTVRVEQTGSRLTMTYPEFPAASPDTGSVDGSGKVTFGFKVSFQEDPREGNRLFFVDLTAGHELQRLDDGARLAGSGSYVNIFHEGSATAPVFATCSRTVTTTFARRTG